MATVPVLLPIRFKAYEEGVNLTRLTHNQEILTRIAREKNLTKHCDAALFVNSAYTRYRIVAMFYGVPVLILPPVDPNDLLSIYLKVSRFLRKFSVNLEVTEFIDQEIVDARSRVADRRLVVKKFKTRRAV